MIGWYHTGPKLRASDLEINDLFKRYIAKPVMVIVDVRPGVVGIPTDAYYGVEEIKDVGVLLRTLEARRLNTFIRMAQKPERHSCMSPQQLRPKRRRKSASNTFYET